MERSRISEANPGIPLPAARIVVVHRSDGSGTSGVIHKYRYIQSGFRALLSNGTGEGDY